MAKRTAALALTHALVDFTCALLLFSRVGAAWLPAALVYNFCAFALQLPLGALCDRRHDPVRTAAASGRWCGAKRPQCGLSGRSLTAS